MCWISANCVCQCEWLLCLNLVGPAALTQSEWGWTRCCGCGPWCPESSCSAAYTRSCSLWSRPGAERRGAKGRGEERQAGNGRVVEGRKEVGDEEEEVRVMDESMKKTDG